MPTVDIHSRIRPGRTIAGHAAVLVPYTADGAIDWPALEAHIGRTVDAGLTPAVNMDTGYVQLLSPGDGERVLDLAAAVAGDGFLAGAFVADEPGDPFDLAAYLAAAVAITERGGVPVVFPSHGLSALEPSAWVDALAAFGEAAGPFVAFELGPMFVPYGRIYPLATYRELLDVTTCIGAKHSSLSRQLEWDRLAVRDAHRPDFLVLTGNDLAIDMVMYGSDYLLGLATFAPEAFAERDRRWAAGEPGFYELNDLLQHLGQVAFRAPVPAYRHDAAMFFELRGWASSDVTPPGVPRRPESDRDLLRDIAERLGALP